MEVRIFDVIFEPFEENGVSGYNVTVPELPGCNTWGETMDEAKAMAEDAILGYLEALKKEGQDLPGGRAVSERMEIPVPA